MFFDLAKGLQERGHEVRVVARNVGQEYLGEQVVEGLQVKYCPWKSMFGHPFPRKKDIEEVIAWCDVVHTSIFTTSPVVSRLARKYKKKSLLTIYEARGSKWYWADDVLRATIFYLVEQFTCKQRFDGYHAISDATKKDIITYCKTSYIHEETVKRVYLANEMKPVKDTGEFSLREYFGIKASDRVFLYYGRPGKTKGITVYEKAILQLKQQNRIPEDVKFCFLLGKEPEDMRAAFLRRRKENGLEEIVKVQESVERRHLSMCISQANYVVVPSLTEGFGFSALEACQIGTPLIYSDGGSLPEVAYGKCLSFENRNSEHLAQQIARVIDEGLDAFEEYPEKVFTYENMIGGIEALYKAL